MACIAAFWTAYYEKRLNAETLITRQNINHEENDAVCVELVYV